MGRDDGVDSNGELWLDNEAVRNRGSKNKWKRYDTRKARNGGNGGAGGIAQNQKENVFLGLVRGIAPLLCNPIYLGLVVFLYLFIVLKKVIVQKVRLNEISYHFV